MSWAKSFILFQMLFFEFHTQNIPFNLKSIPILELLHENISELRLFFMVIGIQKEPSFEIDSFYNYATEIIKKKLTSILIFTFFCGASKSFMKAFKALVKLSEAPQRSVKIKV